MDTEIKKIEVHHNHSVLLSTGSGIIMFSVPKHLNYTKPVAKKSIIFGFVIVDKFLSDCMETLNSGRVSKTCEVIEVVITTRKKIPQICNVK